MMSCPGTPHVHITCYHQCVNRSRMSVYKFHRVLFFFSHSFQLSRKTRVWWFRVFVLMYLDPPTHILFDYDVRFVLHFLATSHCLCEGHMAAVLSSGTVRIFRATLTLVHIASFAWLLTPLTQLRPPCCIFCVRAREYMCVCVCVRAQGATGGMLQPEHCVLLLFFLCQKWPRLTSCQTVSL